jgi:hypothetical protein
VGTDFTWEDANEGPPSLPQEFNISFLGKRRILALVHIVPEAFKNCGTATQALPEYYYPSGASVVPWAKPVLGKWELRDAYVLEMKRLPAFDSGYCYSNRVCTSTPRPTSRWPPNSTTMTGSYINPDFHFLSELSV